MLTFLVALQLLVPPALGLSLDEALQAARGHHPLLRQMSAQTASARLQAYYEASQMLPQLSGSAQYSRSTANFAAAPAALPTAINKATTSLNSSYNYFSFALMGSQLIYDFGQSYFTYRALDATAVAQAHQEASTLSQVLFNARAAYFNARAKKALLGVARDTLANQEKHRAQVRAFVDVGKRPSIDLLQAQADYSSSALAAINAAGDYQVAKAQLNQAMGVERDLTYDVADATMPAEVGEDRSLAEQLGEALQARPDYLAAAAQKESLEHTLRSDEAGYAPTIMFSAGLTDAGETLNDLVWNWRVGVNLVWPLFGSGETYYTVAGGQANLLVAAAGMRGVQQQVRLDVQQAHLGVASAKEALGAANDALVNAKQLLAVAEGRYSVGLGTMIELGDAQVALSSAASQFVQAEYQVASARAGLLRSVGR